MTYLCFRHPRTRWPETQNFSLPAIIREALGAEFDQGGGGGGMTMMVKRINDNMEKSRSHLVMTTFDDADADDNDRLTGNICNSF